MKTQDDFFSPKHKQLLSVASWAKYLAWVALVFAILYAGISTVLSYLVQLRMVQQFDPFGRNANDILSILNGNPNYLAELTIGFIFGILKGVIYYLVLKGVSLGLNLVVETDINYRYKGITDRETIKTISGENKPTDEPGLEPWEAKILDAEDQPNFFDTSVAVELIRKLSKAANWVLALTVLAGIYNLPITSLIMSGFLPHLSDILSTIWASLFIFIGKIVNIILPYLTLKALAYILRVLMEMEFNSRMSK